MVTSPDITYLVVPMGLWSFAELATGVIISCLPVIPRFFQHVGPRISATIFNKDKLSGDWKQQLNPKAALMYKEGACGFVLPFWTRNSGSGRPETLSVASSHYAHLNKDGYTSERFETAPSKDNASFELDELPMARPAKTRNNLAGSGREL